MNSLKKYYVSSGDLQCVLLEKTPRDAAKFLLKKSWLLSCYDFGKVTQVSQKGFRTKCDTAMFFWTEELLKEVV